MWLLQLAIVGFSSFVILCGDFVWENLWPQKFCKLQIVELRKCAKKDLWNLRSIEWEVMRKRVELSIAVSEAGDKAECLGIDCAAYKAAAKQEALFHLHRLMRLEAKARFAYEKTVKLLKDAEEKLANFI